MSSGIEVRTEAERIMGVNVVNAAYPPGDVRRYGAVGTRASPWRRLLAWVVIIASVASGIALLWLTAAAFRVATLPPID